MVNRSAESQHRTSTGGLVARFLVSGAGLATVALLSRFFS